LKNETVADCERRALVFVDVSISARRLRNNIVTLQNIKISSAISEFGDYNGTQLIVSLYNIQPYILSFTPSTTTRVHREEYNRKRCSKSPLVSNDRE